MKLRDELTMAFIIALVVRERVTRRLWRWLVPFVCVVLLGCTGGDVSRRCELLHTCDAGVDGGEE